MNNTSLFSESKKKAQAAALPKNKRYYKPQFFNDAEGEEETEIPDNVSFNTMQDKNPISIT